MDMTNPEKLQALARDVFHLICVRLDQEGLKPDNEIVGEMIVTVLASHWAFRGGGEVLKWVLLDMTLQQMNKAEELMNAPKH